MAIPPFNFAEGTPADSDIVSQYPNAERTFRDQVESAMGIEHDIPGSARHKFGVGADAARDAITTWVVGSIWFNTKTTPVTLQRVVSIGPVVWEDVGANFADASYVLMSRHFART